MQTIQQNAGVDVDAKTLKVSFQIMREDRSLKIIGSRTFKNTLEGFSELWSWLEKRRTQSLPIHITMEATGVYYENLAYFLYDQPQTVVHVMLPNKTAAYMKSFNIKSKTDEIDARSLGQMGLERALEVWIPGSSQMRQIKKLVRERLRLCSEKTLVSNQLHAESSSFEPDKSSTKRYKQRINFIEKQIKEIEIELKKLVAGDELLQRKINNVCTVQGLAFITAIGVVAETDGFALFTNRNQVVSYAGYDVVKRESGTSIRGKEKISKKGNSYIRRMLYMPAMAAARHDEHHRSYYKRVVESSGVKMKANVAIQRKLLLLIYVLFKKNEAYDPTYHEKMKAKLANKKREVVC